MLERLYDGDDWGEKERDTKTDRQTQGNRKTDSDRKIDRRL